MYINTKVEDENLLMFLFSCFFHENPTLKAQLLSCFKGATKVDGWL